MVMGATNKICSRFATKIFYSFPNEKIDGVKHIHTGHILNSELIEGLTDMTPDENERLKVLVVAGSQGSKKIFQSIADIAKDSTDIDFHIIL